MKILKYKWCLTFIFCLVITGAFSLLWVRQQIYLQASVTSLLEKKLASIVELNKRADLCIIKLQNKQLANITPTQPQQIIWVSPENTPVKLSTLALNY